MPALSLTLSAPRRALVMVGLLAVAAVASSSSPPASRTASSGGVVVTPPAAPPTAPWASVTAHHHQERVVTAIAHAHLGSGSRTAKGSSTSSGLSAGHQGSAPILSIARLRILTQAPPQPLTAIGHPKARPGYSIERVAYVSQGLRVTATLLVPDTPGRHPLVIALHGFATPSTYNPGGDILPLAIPLASHGVLVGIPDYRGLAGGAPDPRTEPLPIADAADSIALLDDLLADPRVDPNKVGIVGHSLGGNVGEILLAVEPGIRAATLYAPAESDDNALYARRPGYFVGRPGLEGPIAEPSVYQAMSPGANYGQLHCLILLQQGTADRVVPPHASVVAAQELRAAGASVELRMIPGATHDLDQPVWAPALAQGTAYLLQSL